MSNYKQHYKDNFKQLLRELTETLSGHVATDDRQWTIKGFIDVFRNVYTISADTKIVSKILEIHLFPVLLKFAQKHNYIIVLADHQNYYPDLSFVSTRDESIKFAVDIKTTYRLPNKPGFCNGFTLGSHGSYFIERDKKKNIQYSYNQYCGHFCIGIIYTRANIRDIDETTIQKVEQLQSITSVIRDFEFFACEKWEIASDSQGSGNTANIGSIVRIKDILSGNGVLKNLGEEWFDEYWMNYGKIMITTETGKTKKITKLNEFLVFKGKDPTLAYPCIRSKAETHDK
ncbi:type II restriction endonuclease [Candidatus Magnetominusculus xianensis]|uniref:Restriction endonuclease EcoRV n=1 Tax=Candidatus Magnetominusculus xianensis TaxID=1748249 RepID=A0ABR5SHA4_9BACT|nr:type II restriction endonuclease [Candidatus Magnetominusculus xianensis]KWT91055.1 restriction endonuclease EcoRV [Candidatus Magnetominusculus xianensis]MBF0403299.1 EcoRV family type II restriction endonuclease [Nitrospirota bacterium]